MGRTLRDINEMSFGDFVERYGGNSILQAVFVFLLVKMFCSNIGRVILLALIVAVVIWARKQ
jgi:hypothetical protein